MVSLFVLLIGSIGLGPAYSASQPASFVKADSLPSRQKNRSFHQTEPFRLTSYQPALRSSPRFHTVIVPPGKHQSGQAPINGEIALPIGFDEKTLTVRVGPAVLQAGKDYRYNTAVNRLQILNQAILQSEKPIEITYDTMPLHRKL
ncbi:hypothetical protein GCM10028803_58150 [Larkinella knui]|uniref:Gingipain propeptide domain-containing protein n=1 Tax=Larkinella knui TaxID=2025310 RepID=A0A3P1CHM0_9BACT|nr:hypothetical protein [Larkinella knui]RRB12750.1 hypothetical protein EHT87_21470 [Larkinella knui]